MSICRHGPPLSPFLVSSQTRLFSFLVCGLSSGLLGGTAAPPLPLFSGPSHRSNRKRSVKDNSADTKKRQGGRSLSGLFIDCFVFLVATIRAVVPLPVIDAVKLDVCGTSALANEHIN